MKKILGVAVFIGAVLPFAATAHDHNPPGGADCGMVGSSIMKGKSGLVNHLFGATTNATFTASAIYGMTTGTLGCKTTGNISPIYASLEQRKTFVASNFDKLAHDSANGNGSYLDAFASLIGVDAQDKEAFFSVMKENYEQIFSGNANNMLASLDKAMIERDNLAKYAAHHH